MAWQRLHCGRPFVVRYARQPDKGRNQVQMAGERRARSAGLGCGVRDKQRHMGVFLVDERTLALQPAVGTAYLAVVSREDNDRIPPQLHIVHDIDNLLNAAVAVPNGVQIVVVEDGPHILAICRDRSRPAIPALLVFQQCTGHAGGGERFLEARWKCEGPIFFVDRVRRWRRSHLWRDWLLNWGFAGDITVPEHDVVRIDETRHHEEGLACPARLGSSDAQPADAFPRNEWIVVKAAQGVAADVATRTEYVEAVRLSGLAVVNCRLRVEDLLVHLKLAKVRSLVAECLQQGAYIRNVRI